jgi:hypothetical protein
MDEEVKSITFEVFCQHCGEQILTPADCSMELFRLGYQLHNGNCQETFLRQVEYEQRAQVGRFRIREN